jgi:uncharacterized repeat protein (TIGR02543 family)
VKPLLCAFVSCLFFNTAFADRFYVSDDASPGGDGSSWGSAYQYLQDALDQTVAGRDDEVWIEAGTYYPDDGANVTEGDRTASFNLVDGVTLFGGFAGGETGTAEREWDSNLSILSGEIYEQKSFWSLHVCHVADGASVLFDGLTITKGNANADQYSKAGAVVGSNVEARNCTFTENHTTGVSGVTQGDYWNVINCVFSDNSASSGGVTQGGYWNVINCVFVDNSASSGGVASGANHWAVTDCVFLGNSAQSETFSAAGGVATGCKEWNIANSVFISNSAEKGGVARSSNWTIANCTFYGNEGRYGSVAHDGGWKISNSIVWGLDSFSFYKMDYFTNLDPNVEIPDPSTQRSGIVVEGGLSAIDVSGGNPDVGDGYIIEADPLFVDASDPDGPDDIWGTADDGLRLQAGSPAVAQGNADILPLDAQDVDFDGVTSEPLPLDAASFLRVQGGSLDLGAYEYGNETTPIYTLNVSSQTGGTSDADGLQNYSEGFELSITATVQDGYIFDGWSGDASGTDNPLSVTMNSNLTIAAVFAQDTTDSDGDGLTAYQEYVIYGTNPEKKDTDDDGIEDKDEIDTGLDPLVDNTPFLEFLMDNPSLIGLFASQEAIYFSFGQNLIELDKDSLTLDWSLMRTENLSVWEEIGKVEIAVPKQEAPYFFRFELNQ